MLWKYLVYDYLKVMALCTISFVAILLTLRFDEIAHFACLGSSAGELAQFITLQLPYLLPIALPIAALISSYLLFSRLSIRQELTALRACGVGLFAILTPILITATFLTAADFYLTSEIASQAHLTNGQLRHKLRTINPLILLQNKRILSMQGISCETLGTSTYAEFAGDVFFAIPDMRNQRIDLALAQSIRGDKNAVIGENVTFILPVAEENGFDALNIENISLLETPYDAFTPALQQKSWNVHPDHLQLALLNQHLTVQKDNLSLACEQKNSERCKEAKKNISRVYTELGRRVSAALALFTFTLLGAAFSIQIGRQQRRWSMLTLGLLSGVFLLCYFLAKSLDDKVVPALLLYFVPQLFLISLSSFKLYRLNHGKE
ncbi:MAG: LptF/LptG family permease [Parachlamydiales bacterium]|jgi:lipopolysaccharide export system permease protein